MTLLKRLGDLLTSLVRRWLPDTFVFALLLTLATGAAAMIAVQASAGEVLSAWYNGFWMLLGFGMQMVLILVTGYAIALAPPVSRLIDLLAKRISRPGQVYLLVIIVGGVLNLVSWGWVVLVAVLGRELATRIEGVDYPYLVACVYLSSGTWVCGLSSSIPLLVNTEGNFLIENGYLSSTIPISATLMTPLNLIVLTLYICSGAILMWLLRPRREAVVPMQSLATGSSMSDTTSVADEAKDLELPVPAFSDWLNNNRWLQLTVVAAGVATLWQIFAERGFDLDLNLMIFIFLVVGLALHSSPMRYSVAMRRSCANISGIVFQYPFYAGIMGIMMATGLSTAMASWMVERVSVEGLPLAAYFLGALVNFSIPSAGGEWAVVGPPLVETAHNLAASMAPAELERYLARVAMSVAYGESLTNLLQPFFLLTVLPVMGVGIRIQARDIMGFVLLPFMVIFTVIAVVISILPW